MRQPSTGVRGSSAVAMLSSLLNISDSVPPVHIRSATTFHFFPRDLGARTDGTSIVFPDQLIPAPGPARTLPPLLTQRALTFLKLPSGPCADPAGKRSRPRSSPRGCAAASPATLPHRTADTWGQVTTITPMGVSALCQAPGPCLSPTGSLQRQKWARRGWQSPDRNPRFGLCRGSCLSQSLRCNCQRTGRFLKIYFY